MKRLRESKSLDEVILSRPNQCIFRPVTVSFNCFPAMFKQSLDLSAFGKHICIALQLRTLASCKKNYSILLVIGFARFPICFLPRSAVLFHNHFVLQILWIRGSKVYLSDTFNPYWGKCNSSSFYWKSSPFGQWSLRWAIVRTVFVFLDQTTINAIDRLPQTTEIKLSL